MKESKYKIKIITRDGVSSISVVTNKGQTYRATEGKEPEGQISPAYTDKPKPKRGTILRMLGIWK